MPVFKNYMPVVTVVDVAPTPIPVEHAKAKDHFEEVGGPVTPTEPEAAKQMDN